MAGREQQPAWDFYIQDPVIIIQYIDVILNSGAKAAAPAAVL
jgi:hypothetical protein